MTDSYDNLRKHLTNLLLKTIAAIFEEEAAKTVKTNISYSDYLKKLIEKEVANKTDRSINAKITKAKFLQLKILESFEFSFQPSIDEKHIRKLAHLGFMQKAEIIVFLGPPGVGKSHLAIALGIKACFAKKRVLFASAAGLVDDLMLAYSTKTLADRLVQACAGWVFLSLMSYVKLHIIRLM